jgi:exportin-2 (importin alpha re-exporter)
MIHDADVDDLSFGVGFTQLNTCRKVVRDPFPEVSDVKAWVGSYLKDADSRHGGRIRQFVTERLNDQQRQVLGAIMAEV